MRFYGLLLIIILLSCSSTGIQVDTNTLISEVKKAIHDEAMITYNSPQVRYWKSDFSLFEGMLRSDVKISDILGIREERYSKKKSWSKKFT